MTNTSLQTHHISLMTRLLLTSTLSLQIPTCIFNPQVANLLNAARIYNTIWHYASDASALTMRPLRKECQISLYISTKRGYQKQIIDQAIEEVRHIDIQNLLSFKPKPTANKAVLPFVMTCHPDLPNVRGIVDNHRSIIEALDHLSKSSHRSQSWPSGDQKASEIILCGLV